MADLGRQIYDYYIAKGLAPHQAAALAGNFAWESGGRTDAINPWDNRREAAAPHSIGIAQWNGQRALGLLDLARRQGIELPEGNTRDPRYMHDVVRRIPLETQLDYAWKEMQGRENRSYANVQGAGDLRGAMAGAVGYYRPAGWTERNPYGAHSFNGRMALAQTYLDGTPAPTRIAAPSEPRPEPMAVGAPRAYEPPPAPAPSMPSLGSLFSGIGSQSSSLDAKSFYDTLDRSGYKAGGRVGAIANALAVAAKQTDRNPTPAQAEAGNYRKGKVRIAGMEIAIENPKGSTRSGTDKDGKAWQVTLPAHYGDIKRTVGKDGDAVDVYIGDDHASDKVFIVDQVDAASQRFDEHKALLGFPSKDAALSVYKKAFSDGKGAQRIGAVTETTVEKFKDWLNAGDTTKRASVQAFAAGGKVMPIKTSKGAIAAALDTARRYTRKGKAAGGPIVVVPTDNTLGIPSDPRERNASQKHDLPWLWGPWDVPNVAPRKAFAGGGWAADNPGAKASDADLNVMQRLNRWLNQPLDPDFATRDYSGPGPAHPGFDYRAVRQRQQQEYLRQRKERGYAGGGWAGEMDTPADLTRDILPPKPKAMSDVADFLDRQQKLKLLAEAEAERNPERSRVGLGPFGDVGRAALGLGSAMLPPVPHWPSSRDEALSQIGEPKSMGEFATDTAVPTIATSMMPLAGRILAKAPRVTGGLAALLGPMMPGEATPAEGPARYDGPKRPSAQVKQIQKQLKDAGYNVEIDGTDGGATRDAEFDLKKKQADADRKLAIEEEAARTRTAEAKTKQDQTDQAKESADRTAAERSAGLAQLEKVEGDPTNKPWINPNYAYLAGYPLGALAGVGVSKLFQRGARSAMEEANKLLEGINKGKIAERAPKVNAFYKKGGANEEPFLHDPGKVPNFKPNPKAPAAGDLYPTPSAKPEWLSQAGTAGFWGLDSGITGYMGHNATLEKEAAAAELAKNPNAATITRFLDARHAANNWDAATNAFRAMALGQLSAAKVMTTVRPDYKPNVSAGEAARGKVDEAITKKKGEVKDYAAKAKADKAAKAEQKAERAEARKARKNGAATTGAAGLTAGLLAPSPSGEEASASPRSYLESLLSPSSDDGPYATGGLVNKQETTHHSYYQPRDEVGKYAGGPVIAKKSGGLVSRALDVARRYARGGKVVVGAITGNTGGRTDALPVDVPSGSYVIPADCVSALGEGNSLAGDAKLTKMFGKSQAKAYAAGGNIPIKISHGEFVITPEQVAKFGGGDMEVGHKALDQLVKRIRADHVRTLSSLPPPQT